MKIILGITKSNFGGAQRYVFDLARSYKAIGHDVSVICGGDGILVRKLNDIGITCHILNKLGRDISLGDDVRSFMTIYRLLKKECPDVFHVNSSKMAGIGSLAGRLAGIRRIVFTGHAWAFNESRSQLSRSIIAVFHVITILLSHITIVVSDKTRADIVKLPLVPKKKVIRIYNGIDMPEWLDRHDARTYILDILQREGKVLPPDINERLWLGTFSELHPTKGIDLCIRAIATLPAEYKARLAYFVCGDGDYYAILRKLVADHNLSEQVYLLGYVPQASRYVKAFDVFSLTSRTEALPYAVIEACSAGIPVIASRVGGIPEILGADHPYLTEPNDPSSITKILQRFIKTPKDVYGKIAERLQADILSRFSLDTCVRQTLNVYDSREPGASSS